MCTVVAATAAPSHLDVFPREQASRIECARSKCTWWNQPVSPLENDVIVTTTRITVQPEKRRELLQTIGRLVEPIAGANGCRTFRFYVDAEDENSSLLVSEWESESDLNRYLRSNDFAILRGAITVLSVRSSESRAFITSQVQSLTGTK